MYYDITIIYFTREFVKEILFLISKLLIYIYILRYNIVHALLDTQENTIYTIQYYKNNFLPKKFIKYFYTKCYDT